jgi:hypothetical protein
MSASRLAIFLLFIYCANNSKAQTYSNVAPSQGLDFLALSDNFGNGVSFFDFDQDGWDDLSFTMSNDSLEFYRNNLGTLERLPSFVYGDGVVKHVLWVDYDNDGDMDIMVSPYQKPYKLYQNDGAFNFTDVSVASGLAQVNEKHYGVSFGDYNRDGFLDLYVCTYEFEGDLTMYNKFNHLYRNDGDGTFTDVTLEAGVQDGITFSFQSIWMDYDKDGWQDLLVINDRLNANSLYHNNTDGTFTNVAVEAGVAWPGQDPMTASVADFDNDGDLDVFHSNTGIVNKHFRLWVNNDNGTFTESAIQYGLEVYSWTWGGVWVDYDNDSFQDLYVTSSLPNGALESNFFFTNFQGIGFLNGLSNFTGNHTARSFSASRGDLNNDGFYEIAVQNQSPSPPFLWQNSGGNSNYIKITLQGTVSNRMAIGSWIRVYAGGNQYTQYTLCGENYVGQNSQHHIFGLAEYDVVDSISIEYLSGHIDSYYNLPVNQHYYFAEGDTYQTTITYSGSNNLCQGDSLVLYSGAHYEVMWSTGSTADSIVVTAPGNYWFTAYNQIGISAQSDIVEVNVFPLPVVTAIVQNPLCEGNQNGTILLVNDLGIPAQEVLWDGGLQGDSLTGLGASNYFYQFVDANGCQAEGLVQLIEPQALLVQVFTSPDFGNNEGSINIIINGGTLPYQIFINGSEGDTNIEGLPSGGYEVLIIDANGCESITNVFIDLISSTFDIDSELECFVYPNPLSNQDEITLTIKGYMGIIDFNIIDVFGRSMMNSQTFITHNSSSVNIGTYAAGMYLLKIKGTGFNRTLKLVVR